MLDVSQRMAKGAGWMLLFRISERSIGLLSTLILARLLFPEDFGLVAMAMSVIAILEVTSAFGFDVALIQHAHAHRPQYDTAWTFNALFGLMKAGAMVALAIPAAVFFGDPRVTGVLCALAVCPALNGVSNIGIVAFQKELALHNEFRLGILKKLAGFISTIALALWLHSYWALIGGMVASSATALALSYTMHPYRPRFNLQARGELLRFSKWLLLNNLIISLVHRAPDLIVGRTVGPAALGTYSVAYEISNLPTTELVFPISRAVFPGYSIMASHPGQLQRGFLDVLSVVLLLTIPAGLGLVVLAEPIVYVLLGARWAEAIPLIQVLGVFGVLRASSSNIGAVFLALGRPRILTYLALIYLTTLLLALWWLVETYGALGAAMAALLTSIIHLPITFSVAMRTLNVAVGRILSVLWRPLTAGLIMAGTLIVLQSGFRSSAGDEFWKYLAELVLLVPLGAGVYVGTVFCLWHLQGRPRSAESLILSVSGTAYNTLVRRFT